MTELPVLLIDNFTFSMNYKSDPDFFTIALLPDSSAYVADAPEILGAQARYLAEESRSRDGEPIVFVSHLGGLVPAEAEEEHWEIVDDAMKLLDRSVPYGVAPAISDFQEAEDPELGSPLYLEIFPPDRFRDQSGRFVPSEDEYSSYRILDTPVGEVLSLHLVVDPSPDTLEWARNVLNRHRTLPTIVTTPSYLEVADGVPGRRLSKVLNNYDDTWQGVPAQTMWEELIWPNDQVFLVACGDGPSEALSIGWNGSEQPVIEMLAAYGDRPDGAEGYLRLLRVYPDRSELRVLTYSPWLDTYEQDADSFFRLPLDISGRLGLE